MTKGDEIEYMRLAIREAKRSKAEDDRPHPYVGVVVLRGDEILATACRGDFVPGNHAEYTVLEKKLASDTLAGCTVYTTLEPCTTRNHPKVPCADRLIQRRVGRVVIGALDPDQRITGRGLLRLRRAGISVDLFPPELMAEVEELNRDFIRDREGRTGTAVPPELLSLASRLSTPRGTSMLFFVKMQQPSTGMFLRQNIQSSWSVSTLQRDSPSMIFVST